MSGHDSFWCFTRLRKTPNPPGPPPPPSATIVPQFQLLSSQANSVQRPIRNPWDWPCHVRLWRRPCHPGVRPTHPNVSGGPRRRGLVSSAENLLRCNYGLSRCIDVRLFFSLGFWKETRWRDWYLSKKNVCLEGQIEVKDIFFWRRRRNHSRVNLNFGGKTNNEWRK